MAKILVADDDLDIQELIKFALESEGHQVITASDGKDALDRVFGERPDLVMLDVHMPKMNGFEVCEKLRGNPATSFIPVIMVTSLTKTTDRITGIKLGADDYLCKPFEPMELTARVEALLRRVKIDMSVNPVTGLPGSVMLEREIEQRIADKAFFSVLYLDIDNLKPYNTRSGFENGTAKIKLAGRLLQNSVSKAAAAGAFVSHTGADDFVILSSPEKALELAKQISESFPDEVLSQEEKSGQQLSVSIGVITVEAGDFRDYSEVLEKAKVAWNMAKSVPGCKYVVG